MANEKTEYTASSLRALTDRQHLLKRMNLTFGPPEGSGVQFSSQKLTAIREIQDNSIDEAVAGYADRISIKFFKDRAFECIDNGRGIPVDIGVNADGAPVSGIYLALGVIQSGGKFETDSNRFSSGLNGVGASSTVAVSKRADVTVWRNKKQYSLSFKDGEPGFFDGDNGPDDAFTPLEDLSFLKVEKDSRSAEIKKHSPTGTRVKIWLDDKVFSTSNPYNDQDIIERIRGTAFLVPNVKFEVYNELKTIENLDNGKLEPQTELFHFPRGIEESIDLVQPDQRLTKPIRITTEGEYLEKNVAVLQKDGKIRNENVERRVPIDVIFSYGEKYDETIESYVNTIRTKLGGVHETSFAKALVAAFTPKFQSMRGFLSKKDEPPNEADFLEGLTAIISVQVSEPSFTHQSKEELSGREVQKAILVALTKAFEEWIADRKNLETLQLIGRKVTTAAKNRQRAKDLKELNRKKNEISAGSLPNDLVDCALAGTEDAELYICEGQSALTALKAARDGQRNALLGIRGKIINTHKAKLKDVLKNQEVQDIIKTLGAGSGADFDIEKMRYGRIFIAVDADADGNAIACLLYTLFWHLFRPVIENNLLYKIETPLFVFSTKEGAKSRKIYAKDEKERDRIIRRLENAGTKYSITRLKGLGEVDEDDLEETAINPETRIVTRLNSDNLMAVEEALELIFGDDTGPRKQWIEEANIDEELIKD